MVKAIKKMLAVTALTAMLTTTYVFATDKNVIDPPIGITTITSTSDTIDPPIGSSGVIEDDIDMIDPPIIKL